MTQQAFGSALKRLRESRDLTQSGLASLAMISLRSLRAYEQGTRSPPLAIVHRLCSIMSASVDSLLADDSK